MFEFLKFLCYITVHLKLYSFVKIDHGGRQNRKNKTKFFSFHFSIRRYSKQIFNFERHLLVHMIPVDNKATVMILLFFISTKTQF